MNARTRSTVSVVTRPPSRNRLTSLPSFTASLPNVEFRHAGAAAVLGDVAQERFAHRTTSRIAIAGSEQRDGPAVNHNYAHSNDGQEYGTYPNQRR